MTQVIKVQPKEAIEKSMLQLDEDGDNLIIKSTSVKSDSQIQLILTKLEAKRLSDYFIEKHLKELKC